MVAAAQKALGGLDILINNAGIGLHADVRDISVEDLGYVFQVNVLAPHVAILAALPEMLAHRRGHIVNVGSVASHVSAPHMGGYAASKFALKALSDSLRSELKGSGVGVTLVCPGPVKTMFAANVRGAETSYLPRRPLGAPVEGCAKAIVQGIERGTAEVFYPGYWQGLVGANAMFPQFMRAFGAAFVRRGARILAR
jgi:short-subunit dehydrogenase